ncbi:MAG: hypothetical protein ACTSUE_17895, partial [Promethearchaeota archaeon]
KTLYWSKSGLSSKICFPAKVLGPPDVPCFIDAEVSIQLQKKELGQYLTPYISLIESFGLDPTGETLPPHISSEKEDSSEVEQCNSASQRDCKGECTKEIHSKRVHGNRNHKTGEGNTGGGNTGGGKSTSGYCNTKKQPVASPDPSVASVIIPVTSSDTLAPHPITSQSLIVLDQREEKEDDAMVEGKQYEKEHVQDHNRAKTVGYYYYYDPEAKGYYYYHPHVHCDWDLKFNQGAGICEIPGKLHSDTTHIAVIVLSTIGIAVGLAFCVMDWKSRVLFIHGG